MTIPSAAAELAALTRPRTSAADCCVYARDLLVRAYDLEPPAPEQHALWCIHLDADGTAPPGRVWGPVTAAAEAGIAAALVDEPQVGRWHLVQGWRTLRDDGRADPSAGDRGHTWLWYAATPDLGVVVDSARERGPRAAGWQSWDAWVRSYPAGVRAAVLRRPTTG